MYRAAMICVAFLIVLAPFTPSQEPKAQLDKAKNFEVRIVKVGDSYQAIRIRIRTGETWTAEGTKWLKIADAGPIPAGDYDVLLVATEKDYSAIRYDRVSGSSWLLRGGDKWVKMTEPE